MTSHATLPAAISGQLHPSLTNRITRMYSARPFDIFNELFQNARRAGATAIEVVLTPPPSEASTPQPDKRPPTIVTITDNGRGIDNPQVILTFGQNGWDADTTQREDAAGMGFAALAPLGCTITSWTRNGTAWKAQISPTAFAGATKAPVTRLQNQPPTPSGTTVTFETNTNSDNLAKTAATAAIYFPLPVHLTNHFNPDADGLRHQLPSRPFLPPDHTHLSWNGVTISYKISQHRPISDRSDLNYFGILLDARLPQVSDTHGRTYYALASVEHCHHLELVLPARKDIVENDFLNRLRDRIRQFLIQQMTHDPDIVPSYALYQEAQAFGYVFPVPAARLQGFTPDYAEIELDYDDMATLQPLDANAFIYDVANRDPALDQTVARIFKREGLRVFEPHPEFEGFAWYNQRPRITACDIIVHQGTHNIPLNTYQPTPGDPRACPLVDAIHINLTIQNPDQTSQTITCLADLALPPANAYGADPKNRPVLIQNPDITQAELEQLLLLTYFRYDDSGAADSWETQEADFQEYAAEIAATALSDPAKARAARLRSAIFRHLLPLINQKERPVVIHINDTIDITFSTKMKDSQP